MNTANPTALRVGMTGTLDGHRCRVAGRTLVGMQEAGETYYWTEFNLVDDAAGFCADLVYEETEDGPQWSLYILIEPDRPMTVAEAQSKRLGEYVTIDGTSGRITLVSESRVYFIEGEAAEGVEVGDIAHYFNADAGNRTLVASWTGDELELYRGRKLPNSQVAAAFGLPPAPEPRAGAGSFTSGAGNRVGLAMVAILVAFAAFGLSMQHRNNQTRGPAAVQSLPKSEIQVGMKAVLGRDAVEVTGHATVFVNSPARRFSRHEYAVARGDGEAGLLVEAPRGDSSEWFLLWPAELPPGNTGYELAALRSGQTISLAGRNMAVTSLFTCRVVSTEGSPVLFAGAGPTYYGLIAQLGPTAALVRWTESGAAACVGQMIPAKDVTAAFRGK